MSIDINFGALDPALGAVVKCVLNEKLQEAPLPGFVRNLRILDLSLGTIPPDIMLVDMTDPLPLFYEDDTDEDGSDDDVAIDSFDEDDSFARSSDGDGEGGGAGGVDDFAIDDDYGEPMSGRGSRRASSIAQRGNTSSYTRRMSSLSCDGRFLPGASPQNRRTTVRIVTPSTAAANAAAAAARTRRASSNGVTLEDIETASAASSNPPPYAEHAPDSRQPSASVPAAAATGHAGAGRWDRLNVPYFQSAFDARPPNLRSLSYVSASALSAANNTRQTPDRRRSSSGQYLHGDPRLLRLSRRRFTNDSPRRPSLYGGAGVGGCLPGSSPSRLSTSNTAAAAAAAAAGDAQPAQPPGPKATDVQLKVRVRYAGDLHLAVALDLCLNHPAPSFVSLPLKLVVDAIDLDFTAVVAKIDDAVHFAIVDPDDDAAGGDEDGLANTDTDAGTPAMELQTPGIELDEAEVSAMQMQNHRGSIDTDADANADPGPGHPIRSMKVATYIGGDSEHADVETGVGDGGDGGDAFSPALEMRPFGAELDASSLRRSGTVAAGEKSSVPPAAAAATVRDLEKVEKFLVSHLRQLVDEEFCLPSYYTVLV